MTALLVFAGLWAIAFGCIRFNEWYVARRQARLRKLYHL